MSAFSDNRNDITSISNLDKNMFVDAGAGAGKTTLIVERVLQQLKNGYDPDSIVVITFTNKAANELLDRIIRKIAESIKPDSEETEESKKILKKALNSIEDMNISTIHSFCNKLLSENAFEAGIPVGSVLLDPGEQENMEESYFNSYIESFTKEDWNKLFELSRVSRFKTNSAIKDIYSNICGLQKDIPVICPKTAKKRSEIEQQNKRLVEEFCELVKNGARAIAPGCSDLTEADFIDEEIINVCFRGKRDDDLIIRTINKKYIKDGFPQAKVFDNEQEPISSTKGLPDLNKEITDSFLNTESVEDLKAALVVGINKTIKKEADKISDLSGVDVDEPMFKECLSVKACGLVKELVAYKPEDGVSKELDKLVKNILKTRNTDKPYGFFNANKTHSVDIYDDNTIAVQNLALSKWMDSNLDQLIDNYNMALEEYYQLCVKYALKAREYYWNNKPSNVLSNDDLLNYTYDMFNNNSELLKTISKRYRCFYVDEFQDTDRIQSDFIWKMAADLEDTDKLRDGALFVVGDPKQSIYRFRGAEPEVYFKIKEKMSTLENVILFELHDNYRSNKKIIDWVNNSFKTLDTASKPDPADPMAAPSVKPLISNAGFSYENMNCIKPLTDEPCIQEGGKVLAGVYHVNNGDGWNSSRNKYNSPSGDTEAIIEKYAEDLAKLVANLVDEKYQYKITRYKKSVSKGKVEFFPYTDSIKYSDFLILCRNKKFMDRYIREFSKKGIPVCFDGGMNPSAFTGLNAFVRIFRYLSNKKDYAARIGAIEAIWKCGLFDGEDEAFEKGGLLLNSLAGDTYQLNGYAVADELLNRLSLFIEKNIDLQLNELVSIKTKLQQMVETVISSCNGTMMEMATAFEEYLSSSIEHELSLVPEPNAVRFMNVHKAKGLEGNIVIFVDRRKRRNISFDGGIINGTYYPKYSNWNAIKNEPTETFYLNESLSEEHRLEYVLATRAQQALIFMDIISAPNLFADKEFVYGIDTHEEMTVKEIIDLAENPVTIGNVSYDYNSEKHISGVNAEENSKETEARLSPSRFEKYESAEKDKEIKVEDAAMARPKGKDFGKRMHKMLELLISRWSEKVSGISSSELVHICAVQAVGAELDNADYDVVLASETPFLEKIGEAVVANLESTDSILKDAEEIYTELPFSYSFVQRNDDGSDIPAWMNGEADLVIKKKDGSILLIDYKSDSDEMSHEDAFIEHLTVTYTPQIEEYKKALTRIFSGITVESISSMLISFSQKDESGKFYSEPKIRMRFTPLN